MRQSEMAIRRLVEAGNGTTIRISSDLKAWIMPYGDGMADVFIGSKSHGRIVFEHHCEIDDVNAWLQRRKCQHEATLTATIKSGTAYIKDLGHGGLQIMLVSDSDNVIDEATIPHSNLFEWLDNRQDW